MVSLKISRQRRTPLKVKLYDISRAHFYSASKRRLFVTLPEGDEEEGMSGVLKKAMYGAQDAANLWQNDYSEHFESKGFILGTSSTSLFYREEHGIRVLVHGDHFVVLGDE